MRWDIEEKADGSYLATQKVSIEDLESRENRYVISSLEGGEFQLLLSNETVNACTGRGAMNETKIVWEFFYPGTLDGFEIYERLNETEYVFEAEYGKSEEFVTKIKGSMRRY